MDEGKPIDVDEDSFEAEVKNSEIPVVLEFWSPKCSHCQKMHKVLDALAEEFAGIVKVAKVNVLEHVALARPYDVTNIPAFFYIVNGMVRGSTVGAMSKGKLKDELGLMTGTA